ncbi:MAG: aromatic amino acid ammonia-lyase [Gammaproteobacteria bacterium]
MPHTEPVPRPAITLGNQPLTIEDVCQVAAGTPLALDDSPAFRERIRRGAEFLADLLARGEPVYGVTTGFGDSCTVTVSPADLEQLPAHLVRYHGCGLGRYLDEEAARAVLVTRLTSLAQGYSGVRVEILEQLAALLDGGIVPLIPEEGSVGASGDLTPLSYIAAALVGEREVLFRGRRVDAAEALAAIGRRPLALKPKEGLALMNGTSVMTALACLAWRRADYLTRLASRVTAMAALGLQSNAAHFEPALFRVKPHAGQEKVAGWIHGDLCSVHDRAGERIQDRYSIRCAPHVIGVLADALPWMRRDIETELNSANDNPLIDPDHEAVYHGGHFYGGHIAFVADAMKNAVANVADLLDRQLALLVDNRFNNGLPRNLSGAPPERAALNHGFKAVQIGVSAWTAEALKLTMPASVFSRSTECHNQDKVSMGTIAARDALRVLELTEQAAAGCLAAAAQAVELRLRAGELPAEDIHSGPLGAMHQEILQLCAFVDEDRPLEQDLRRLVAAIRQRRWRLYP